MTYLLYISLYFVTDQYEKKKNVKPMLKNKNKIINVAKNVQKRKNKTCTFGIKEA